MIKYIAVASGATRAPILATGEGTYASVLATRALLRTRRALPDLQIYATAAFLGLIDNTRFTFEASTGTLRDASGDAAFGGATFAAIETFSADGG